MAPGVQVARIGTDKWAISIRGFNGRSANKLQVLMDGRSVYNPIFSGVQGESILTIADSPETASKGVIINMSLTQNKITFEVNLESARSVGLDISARLLQLATKVYQ